jgi:hypothetical protein
MNASELAALEAGLQSDGYTITQHFTQNGTTGYSPSYPLYRGMMTKDGIANSVTIVHTNSAMDAQAEVPSVVSIVGSHGFSGNWSPGSSPMWSGSVISSTTGNSMRATVSSSGANVIAVVAAG